MSSESNLWRYLRMVNEEYKYVHETLAKPGEITLEGLESFLEEPEKARAFRQYAKDAFTDIVMADLISTIQPLLEAVQARRQEFLQAVRFTRQREPTDWDWVLIGLKPSSDALEAAFQKLEFVLPAVEAKLAGINGLPPGRAPGESKQAIVFDDQNQQVTIHNHLYPRIGEKDKRAYDLFKLIAEAKGDAVSRRTIIAKVKGLNGKNSIANTRKKLPRSLQKFLKSVEGREGGLRYCDPPEK